MRLIRNVLKIEYVLKIDVCLKPQLYSSNKANVNYYFTQTCMFLYAYANYLHKHVCSCMHTLTIYANMYVLACIHVHIHCIQITRTLDHHCMVGLI